MTFEWKINETGFKEYISLAELGYRFMNRKKDINKLLNDETVTTDYATIKLISIPDENTLIFRGIIK